MPRSETIGAIISALAKAQTELVNPEKSLTAEIQLTEGQSQTFRYASLASALNQIRRVLGSHEIATLQTTEVEWETGHIKLTTMLAHASGEWLSSVWPVCSTKEPAHRMGAALTYARRYALFALVGIVGEDDLDAPDLGQKGRSDEANAVAAKPQPKPDFRRSPQPALSSLESQKLREVMCMELQAIESEDELIGWAQRRLPAKNKLGVSDAELVERRYATALATLAEPIETSQYETAVRSDPERGSDRTASTESPEKHVVPLAKTAKARSKAHLRFVASQPCLICQRVPSDPHHIKFAEPRASGRKVSDEFTVPLCRGHHRELHRHGNERAWWANLKLEPLGVAKVLWATTRASISRC